MSEFVYLSLAIGENGNCREEVENCYAQNKVEIDWLRNEAVKICVGRIEENVVGFYSYEIINKARVVKRIR